jgi:hypothetical protein
LEFLQVCLVVFEAGHRPPLQLIFVLVAFMRDFEQFLGSGLF